MIGLYFSNYNIINAKISASKSGFAVFQRVVKSQFYLALVQPHYLIKENIHFVDDENFLIYDGFIFNGVQKTNAQKLFRLLSARDDLIADLNGEFLLLYSLNGKMKIVSDRMGTRQHYLFNDQTKTIVSPDISWILLVGGLKRIINYDSILTFIIFNKFRHFDQTIWDGIRVFPSASKLSLGGLTNRVQIRKYWEYKYSNRFAVNIEELVKIYRNAVNMRHFEDLNGAVTLSGGLDSRSILSSLSNYVNISAATCGLKDSDEVRFAMSVAKQVGIKITHFPVTPSTFLKNIDISQFYQEDIDLINQAVWRPFLDSMGKIDYVLHGLDLDVTLGGIYLNKKLLSVSLNDNKFIEFLLKNSLSARPDVIQELLKPEINIYEYTKNMVLSLRSHSNAKNYLEEYDAIIMKQSMGRVILKRYSDLRRKVNTITPMYDNSLLEYLYGIPIEERINYKLFHPWYKCLDPQLFSINYQRTGIPGTVPVKFWKQSQDIQSAIEELYRRIAFDSKGAIYIPYNKYYTNFDEWLRLDPLWIKFTNELLLSDDTIITDKFVNRNFLKKLIIEHQNHIKSHMKIILILMSAEIYLRISENTLDELLFNEMAC